ncbi:REM2- and Rab-like small GTPase 1 [Eurytemora carolleeae]|uniref:REM2- and Rab-like small GTPase 1 n=1 Tax=Eurytemora carolleeae TaxID=1294199 RepID=UPI000C792949|nr:REM2- and Rab-like small GTPase 1 [Eurytemora carolleeae]|eukprot:XP_023341620.1 REM2- and Rab-like small GTPase 1 [Eurytemora affinis]
MLRGSVLSPDWYKSGEGQGLLAHLAHPTTGNRRLYGILEYPNIPPSIECVEYKVFLVGETGVGKSAVAGWLAGLPAWNRQAGESPGLRVTTVYWPAKLQNNLRIFKLNIWDTGAGAMKKYGHMYPSCKDGAHGVLVLFSFSDRSSWEEIPALVQRTVLPQDPITPIVVGNRFGNLAETTVSAGEIAEFEQNWNIPVVCVRNQTNSSNPGSITEVATVLNTICEQLWIANRKPRHAINL